MEVIFVEELGWNNLEPLSIVATIFELGGKTTGLGVIGPTRISYSEVIPTLKYFKKMMQEVVEV